MAERIIDGTENNIFNLLCNLADSENSIALDAANKEIEDLNSQIEDISERISSVTSELEETKEQEGIMEKGPAAFSSFVDEFNKNTLLVSYFHILGYDNYLSNPVASHEEEQRTSAKYDEIVNKIDSLSKELEELENESLMLNNKLENDNKILGNIKFFTERIKLLIDASISGNGSYTKDYVIETLSYFQDVCKEFGIIFPSNYIDSGSMAIFFPNFPGKEFVEVVNQYREGNIGKLMYTGEGDTPLIDSTSEDIKDDLFNISVDSLASTEEEVGSQEKNHGEANSSDEEIVFSVPIDDEEDVPTVDQAEKYQDEKIIDFSTGEEKTSKETSSEAAEPVSIIDEIEPTVSEPKLVDEEYSPDVDKVIDLQDVFARMQASIDRGYASIKMMEETEKPNKFGLDDSLISEELNSLLKSADANVVKNNIDNLEALNIDKNYFYVVNDGYSILVDADLVNKINYLRGKKIPEKSVKNAVISDYLRGSLESIKASIIDLENSEYGFDKKYLPLLKYGVQPFFDSIDYLKKSGIEPDESEIQTFLDILSKFYKNIVVDTEVLKDYSVGALRSNGKFELGYGKKTPKQLVEFLDAVIELGEEDLINNVPEVLSMNLDTVLKRLWYVKSNGIDYKEGTVYADYIIKPGLFNREFNNPELGEIKSCEECNKLLDASLNNDLCSIFMEVLDKFYADSRSYKSVELNEEQQGIYEKLKDMLESLFSASLVSKNAYDIQGTIISRNKFERNLSCLVCTLNDNGEDLLSEAKEILLVSALYNSRRPEEMMLKIPQEIQEESVSMGGMAA